MKHDSTNDVACSQVLPSYSTQVITTITMRHIDHNASTIDGKNTHYGLRSISIVNGNVGEISLQRKALPRDKKKNWLSVTSNKGTQ